MLPPETELATPLGITILLFLVWVAHSQLGLSIWFACGYSLIWSTRLLGIKYDLWIRLCFYFFFQSFVYAFYFVYSSIYMLVSVKWTRVYASFLCQKRVCTLLCLNTVTYANFCILFSNISTQIDLLPSLFNLCVVDCCLRNLITWQHYCFEVSSSLKSFVLGLFL